MVGGKYGVKLGKYEQTYLLTYMGVFGFGFEATYRPIRQLIYDKWHLGR